MLMYGAYGFGALAVFVGLFCLQCIRRKESYRETPMPIPELEGWPGSLGIRWTICWQQAWPLCLQGPPHCFSSAWETPSCLPKDVLYLVAVKQTIHQGIASHVNFPGSSLPIRTSRNMFSSTLGDSKKALWSMPTLLTSWIQHYPIILVGADHAKSKQWKMLQVSNKPPQGRVSLGGWLFLLMTSHWLLKGIMEFIVKKEGKLWSVIIYSGLI